MMSPAQGAMGAVRTEAAAPPVFGGTQTAQRLARKAPEKVGDAAAGEHRGLPVGFVHPPFPVHEQDDQRRVFVDRGQFLFAIPERLLRLRVGLAQPQGADAVSHVVGQFRQQAHLLGREGIRFARIDGDRAEGSPVAHQRNDHGGNITALLRLLAPRGEICIRLHVPAAAGLSGADRRAGGTATPLRVRPGHVQALEIAFVETRLRHPLDGLSRIVAGKADPHHGVPAVADDDLADLVEVRRFVGGAHHGLTARAERLEGPVEAIKFRLPFPALRDVCLQIGVRGFELVGSGADQVLEVVAIAGQLRFRAVALGDVAGGGEHALHAARAVAVNHGVVEHVGRPAGNMADRQREIPDEPRPHDQLIAGVRPLPLHKVV